jgi:hypothetical protein
MNSNHLIISLVGDVALNGLFISQPGKNQERLNEVKKILQKSDLVFANLETPLQGTEGSDKKKKNEGVILYSTEDVYDQTLPGLNLTAVSLANNHMFDGNKSGVKKTIKWLEKSGIKFTGAGYKKAHLEPVMLEKKHKRVGFLAYVHKNTHPKILENSEIVVNYFDEEKIFKEVANIKNRCDFIILSIHWGADYSFYPTKYQRLAGHKLIDAGVDVIMGHHPHTLQPFEKYKDGLIFYSLGSLCFGDFIFEGKLRGLKLKTKQSMIVHLNETKQITGLIPTRELIGNRVVLTKKNLKRSLSFKFSMMKLKHKFKLFDWIIRVKEAFFDRLIEYFFGYYRNPFIQLFSLKNLKKMKYSFRDFVKK